jgi:hypothetical protein
LSNFKWRRLAIKKNNERKRDFYAGVNAYQFVKTRIATDFPKNDGKQTPMRNHPVFIAQHATATCCRGCIRKWHGIEKGRALNENEIDYVVALIMEWIRQQLQRID